MPEQTAPVPIPDLLAAIERIPVRDCQALVAGELTIEVIKCGKSWPVDAATLLLIVRGVRALAARVETLTELLSEYGRHAEGCSAPYGYRCRCGWDRESAAALEGDPALAGQSTTEQP